MGFFDFLVELVEIDVVKKVGGDFVALGIAFGTEKIATAAVNVEMVFSFDVF